MRPGFVDGEVDALHDVDGGLVVAVADVREGDLAGGVDVTGALHVRGAEVDQQVTVRGAAAGDEGGLEVGVAHPVLAPALLGLLVAGLAALPGLVAAGEVQDRGVVGDREVAGQAPLDEVVLRVEADEVAVEEGVEDALVVLVQLVGAGAADLVMRAQNSSVRNSFWMTSRPLLSLRRP
ncbi:hypothetical protein SGLAM104S_08569 [Streptomyces glaucescens]